MERVKRNQGSSAEKPGRKDSPPGKKERKTGNGEALALPSRLHKGGGGESGSVYLAG